MEPWVGICYDDGSGKNVYYVDDKRRRQRKVPDNFVPELLSNGIRKYYHRGTCLRCRKESPSIFLHMKQKSIGYCLNICMECMITTVPQCIDKRSTYGMGDYIWECHIDTPKNTYIDLEYHASHRNREAKILQRAREAKFHVRTAAKFRRNADRELIVRQKAAQCKIDYGFLISWGFDTVAFDEYYGEINEVTNEPNGNGVRFYADGSIYIGEWLDGQRHTKKNKAMWTRPDGLTYEGTWVSDQKHGFGTQTFPNGNKYIGEFAKNYEHGNGTKIFPDGSIFEGKFRFGKRDGMGILKQPDGTIEKKVFRDSDVFHEKPLIDVTEEAREDGEYFEPSSLFQMCMNALSNTMHAKRSVVPSHKMHHRLPEYMKQWITEKFLLSMIPKGSMEFITTASKIAFKDEKKISIKALKFINFDCDSLMYIISANKKLEILELVINKLDLVSIDLICKKLAVNTWPVIYTLNLSFNRMNPTILESLMGALKSNPTLRVLKLSGCNITPSCVLFIGRFLKNYNYLIELDLSFNSISSTGAEMLAEAITINSSLTCLNLRHNGLGTIGGRVLAEAMIYNTSIKELCIADNKVGADVVTSLVARLNGSPVDIIHTVRACELDIPARHEIQKKRQPKH